MRPGTGVDPVWLEHSRTLALERHRAWPLIRKTSHVTYRVRRVANVVDVAIRQPYVVDSLSRRPQQVQAYFVAQILEFMDRRIAE